MPLSAIEISTSISKQLPQKIVKKYEQDYILNHLGKLAENIEEGTNDLFDFDNVLAVMQNGTLKDNFDKLGFFGDIIIYDNSKTFESKEFKARVEDNRKLFAIVRNIMETILDPQDQEEELCKTFEDKTVNAILKKGDNWKDIDYSELQKRKRSDVIFVEKIELATTGNGASIITRGHDVAARKSKIYILLCDPTSVKQTLKLTFSDNIKDHFVANTTIDKKVDGRKLYLNIEDEDTNCMFSISSDDSRHDFFLYKVAAKESYFEGIRRHFKLKKGKKPQIVVDIPEGETASIGYGTTVIDYSNVINWTEDYKVIVPDTDHDEEKQEVLINFGSANNTTTKFLFVVSQAIPRPINPLEIFRIIWSRRIIMQGITADNGTHFHKLSVGDEEYYIQDYFKVLLRQEQRFINESLFYLDGNTPIQLEISSKVETALRKIYAYFIKENTTPSLCYVNDELEVLYREYVVAVNEELELLSNQSSLPKRAHNLTKLGVIHNEDNTYALTPFCPIVIAYLLGLKKTLSHSNKELELNILKLMSALYAIPYVTFDSKAFVPFQDSEKEMVKTWIFYEDADNNIELKEKVSMSSIETVMTKMHKFIESFPYFFSDKDSPLKVATYGISDDINIIKGVIKFICSLLDGKNSCSQRIEIHEYVKEINDETFYEKLNRLCSDETKIIELLVDENVEIEKKDKYRPQDLIRQLFTRVDFYKHKVTPNDSFEIGYCHLMFYRIDSKSTYIKRATNDFRVEMSMNGLISVPSTTNTDDGYALGFGTSGLTYNPSDDLLFRSAKNINELFANERDKGQNMVQRNVCVAKLFDFKEDETLTQIYEKSNWVTFLDPEVNIDFFYRQPELYIVHFTDQYTINAKYDSITVTRHVDQYKNLIVQAYNQTASKTDKSIEFYDTMTRYFNSLNGEWLLGVICNKNTFSIREKLSIVATCKLMQKALQRNKDTIWIPISLDEILRVSGAISLPSDSPFSKANFKVAGVMSDDLLFIGLDSTNKNDIKVYFYPVEVKASSVVGSSIASKGEEQVAKTYDLFLKHIIAEKSFEKDVYSTLFMTQFLSNADKLHANLLISEAEYETINDCRFELLNMRYSVEEFLPEMSMGKAGLVSFIEDAAPHMFISINNSVAICNYNLSLRDCIDSVVDECDQLVDYVSNGEISINDNEQMYLTLSLVQNELSETNANDEENVIPEEQETESIPESIIPTKTAEVKEAANNGTSDDKTETENNSASSESLQSSNNEKKGNHGMKILIGHVMKNGERNIPVYFEPNNTNKVSHPNMGIIGTMGTGKTQFAKSVMAQIVRESENNVDQAPVGLLVFDYKGDYNKPDYLDSVNGECYKYAFPFNPLKLIVNEGDEGSNLPSLTADRISDSMARAFGMGKVQKSTIKNVIVSTYADFGITREPSTWNNEPPTMSDVIEKYLSTYDAHDSAFALFDKLNDYTMFTTDKSKCMSLFEWLKGVRVIDLSYYSSSEETKKVIVALILDMFYAEMQIIGESKLDNNLRQLRAMIMVDEASAFMRSEFFSLRQIISQGRMFGVGVILSTQYISDFKTTNENYSQFILSWMIHQVNNISKQEMQLLFGNNPKSEDYKSQIIQAKKFFGLSKISDEIKYIKGLPFFELQQM